MDILKMMLIKVRAFPNSNKEEVVKKSEDTFEVMVKEPPVMGMANKAIIRALAAYFRIPASEIRLIKGFRERSKIFAYNPPPKWQNVTN